MENYPSQFRPGWEYNDGTNNSQDQYRPHYGMTHQRQKVVRGQLVNAGITNPDFIMASGYQDEILDK